MVTVNPSSITVVQAGQTTSTSSPSSCKVGQYITMNGETYPYSYSRTIPSGYSKINTPNFCIYYEGGDATAGCYCNTSNQIFGGGTDFYSNGNGGYWAIISLKPSYFQFSIAFNTSSLL